MGKLCFRSRVTATLTAARVKSAFAIPLHFLRGYICSQSHTISIFALLRSRHGHERASYSGQSLLDARQGCSIELRRQGGLGEIFVVCWLLAVRPLGLICVKLFPSGRSAGSGLLLSPYNGWETQPLIHITRFARNAVVVDTWNILLREVPSAAGVSTPP